MKYTLLSEEDRLCIEAVLTLAQTTVDAQYNDEMAEELQSVLVECAELFGIESLKTNITENDDGSVTMTFEEPETKKPSLRVINGSKPDDDDKIHQAPLLASTNTSSVCNNMLLFFDYNKHNNVTVK